MNECQFYRFGRCRLIEQVSGVRRVMVAEDACGVCQQSSTPETGEMNNVVASLARRAVRGLPQEQAVRSATRELVLIPPGIRPVSERLNGLRCVHRGQQIGRRPCLLCGRRNQVEPVFECSIHGECTLSKYRNGNAPEVVCLTCDQRQPG